MIVVDRSPESISKI